MNDEALDEREIRLLTIVESFTVPFAFGVWLLCPWAHETLAACPNLCS